MEPEFGLSSILKYGRVPRPAGRMGPFRFGNEHLIGELQFKARRKW